MSNLDKILSEARARRQSETKQSALPVDDSTYQPVIEGSFKSWIKIIFKEKGQVKSVGFPYQHLLTCEYIPGDKELVLLVGAGLSFVIEGRGLEDLQAGILDHKVHEIRAYLGQKKVKGEIFISSISRSASRGGN